MSNDPNAGVVYVQMTLSTTAITNGSGVVTGTSTVNQTGSGVLIAPDEILTAAHVVYGSDGQLLQVGSVLVGDSNRSPTETAQIANVNAVPFQNFTITGNMAHDYAIIHLATPITDVPVMALGSNFAGGTANLTGFPQSGAGAKQTVQETMTVGSGGVLNGGYLGSDPHGSSGGPIWAYADGQATVYGDVSGMGGGAGIFSRFTDADVAIMDGWMDEDHGIDPSATSGDPVAMSRHFVNASTAGPAVLDSERQSVNALVRAIQQGGSLADAFAQAEDTVSGASHAAMDIAFLSGAIYGNEGGAAAGIASSLNDEAPGTITGAGTRASALQGMRLGHILANHNWFA